MRAEIEKKKTFWTAILIWAAAFALLTLSSLLCAALVSVGTTAVFVGAGLSSGLLGQIAYVATDVAPGAMFFLGAGCIALAAVIFLLVLRGIEYKGCKKSLNIKRAKACASCAAVFITATVIGLFLQANALKRGNASTVFSEEEHIPQKNYISVNVTNTPVIINNYDKKEILVKYLGETPLSVTENDDKVTLAQNDGFALSLFTLKQFRYKLEIWLPEEDYRSLEIVSASGSVTADAKQFRALSISSKSGDITVGNISAVGNGGSSAVSLKSKQGEITAEFADLPETDELTEIVSGSGNVKIEIPEYAGVFMKFITAKGRFTSDFFRKKYIGVKPPAAGIYLAKNSVFPERRQNDFSIITETGNLTLLKK